MPLDPRIAMGFQSPQFESPVNMMGNMMKLKSMQQQNALAEQQMGDLTTQRNRAAALDAAYKGAYNPQTGEIDYNAIAGRLADSGQGSGIGDLMKKRDEQLKARYDSLESFNKALSEEGKVFKSQLQQLDPNDPNAPSLMAQFIRGHHAPGSLTAELLNRQGITPQQSLSALENAVKTGKFADFYTRSVLGADEFIKRNTLTASEQSMAEDRAAQREISRGQLGVAQGNLAVNQAAEARLGAGSATADKNLAGKQQLSTIIDKMRGAYETLRTEGAAVQPGGDVLGNIGARIRGTGAAQAVEGAIGTKAQSERTKIKNMRPLLVNAIKQATGMSAQQMNSNVELKLFLDTATNPDTADIDANLAALENLNALYGLGLDVGSPPASAAPANSGGNGWGKATIKK